MGQAMAQGLKPAPTDASAAVAGAVTAAAAPAAAGNDHAARLTQLKALLDQGLIQQIDFDNAKAEILKKLIG